MNNDDPLDSSTEEGNILVVIARVVFWLYLPTLFKFGVQMVGSIGATMRWGWLNHLRDHPANNRRQEGPFPKVAVIIPAYNEEVGIVKTIHSVIQNKYPNLQLVVVNDGSTDATDSTVRAFLVSERSRLQRQVQAFRYLDVANGGKARAMNRALQVVDDDTDIIITLDADSVMHQDAINEFVDTFDLDGENDNNDLPALVGGVAGNIVIGNRTGLIGRIQQIEYVLAFFSKRADSFLAGAVHVIGGAAAAYRKQALDQLLSDAVFDESSLTEDVDLSVRLLKKNFQTRFAHNAIVFTEGPLDWKSLANQRLRWKSGGIMALYNHRSLFFSLSNRSLYLCWFLLPTVVYIQLIQAISPILIWPVVAAYAIKVSIWPFFVAIVLILFVTVVAILVDKLRSYHRLWIFASPFAFAASMATEVIEWLAFWRSIYRFVRGGPFQWQKHKRQGTPDVEIENPMARSASPSTPSGQSTSEISTEGALISVTSSQTTYVVSNVLFGRRDKLVMRQDSLSSVEL